MANDRADTLKGSYYVNCAFYKDPALDGADGDYPDLPEYTKGNIWPREGLLVGFKETFQELVGMGLGNERAGITQTLMSCVGAVQTDY